MNKYEKHINTVCKMIGGLSDKHDNPNFITDMYTLRLNYRKLKKEMKDRYFYPTRSEERAFEMDENIRKAKGVIVDICREHGISFVFYDASEFNFKKLDLAARFTTKGIVLNILFDFE